MRFPISIRPCFHSDWNVTTLPVGKTGERKASRKGHEGKNRRKEGGRERREEARVRYRRTVFSLFLLEKREEKGSWINGYVQGVYIYM